MLNGLVALANANKRADPGSALLLAFANATKPLQCCNGLVALANANIQFWWIFFQNRSLL
jgi:hypothetical protein